MNITIKETQYPALAKGGRKLKVSRIRISAKCSDLCYSELQDDQGRALAEHDGYVPACMPGEHYGDYVMLDIDLETGQILNWKKPTIKALEETEWKLKGE
jgi:hypothetical protein